MPPALGLFVLFQILIAANGCKSKTNPPEKLDLAKSTSAEPSALDGNLGRYPGHVVVYSVARGLRVDGAALLPAIISPEVGFPASAKAKGEHDLVLVPLLNAMTVREAGNAKENDRVLVAFEAATPYRAVVEVLFTLVQAAVARFDLLTQNEAGEPRVLPITPPKTGDSTCLAITASRMEKSMVDLLSDAGTPREPKGSTPLAHREAICLSLTVQNLGVSVRSSSDPLDATCTDVAPAASSPKDPTVPATKAGPVNSPALQKCVAALVARHPKIKKMPATVSGSRETKWSNIVPLLDILREAGIEPGFGLI